MNRFALAAVLTLTIPLAALADGHGERGHEREAPRPVLEDRHDLSSLLIRFDEVAFGREAWRELPRVEARILRAADEEIAEARAALGHQRPDAEPEWRGHDPARGGPARQAERATLARLVERREQLARLEGRLDRPSVRRARAVVAELVELGRRAELDGPSPAWSMHR